LQLQHLLQLNAVAKTFYRICDTGNRFWPCATDRWHTTGCNR